MERYRRLGGLSVADSPAAKAPPSGIDVSRPHTARMYDYYLGGENHYPADRDLADKVLASMPAARTAARVVYADNDPLVLAHARALLTSSPAGRTAYLQADLRDPESILAHPSVRELLDFGQPVGAAAGRGGASALPSVKAGWSGRSP